MVVYIEDAVMQNLFMSFIIINLTIKTMKLTSSFLNVLLSSLFGTMVSILISLFNINFYCLIAIKILTGVIMNLLFLKHLSCKKFVLTFTTFLSFTFIMGGLCLAIENLFNIKLYNYIVMLIALLFFIFANAVIRFVYKRQALNSFYYSLILKENNKSFNIKAYLDSGNLLQDKDTGLSILVLDYSLFLKIFQDSINLFDVFTEKLDKKISGKYIQVNTINGSSNMFVCSIDKVIINLENREKKEVSVLIGLGKENFLSKDYDALLSPLAI